MWGATAAVSNVNERTSIYIYIETDRCFKGRCDGRGRNEIAVTKQAETEQVD